MSDEPEWKRTKLSLERPYKDDSGARIPVLLDITSEGEQVVEPYGFWLLGRGAPANYGIESKIPPQSSGRT